MVVAKNAMLKGEDCRPEKEHIYLLWTEIDFS